jgi:dCTP deaminase
VILSDVTIREELAAGRILIEPLSDASIQPSSVDLHCDRFFRVFRNDTTPFIDPKLPQEDLTELVEVPDGRAFILHPGEFVRGSRGKARWAASACSSTAPRASLMRDGTGT